MPTVRIAELTDFSTFPTSGGFDMTDVPITGSRVVLEWVARAWLTRAGDLAWDLTRGRDIERLVNSDHTDAEIQAWQQALKNEALRVDYVVAASVTISAGDPEIIIIDGGVTLRDVDGVRTQFPLEVRLSDAAAAILTFGRPNV